MTKNESILAVYKKKVDSLNDVKRELADQIEEKNRLYQQIELI